MHNGMQITKETSTKKYPHIIVKFSSIVSRTASAFLQNTVTSHQSCRKKEGGSREKLDLDSTEPRFSWFKLTISRFHQVF
jgi:hypothetical protein